MYKTINGWTKEKIIARIQSDFKGKSEDSSEEVCMYRGPKGTKCAVGLFIPDSVYHNKMERKSAAILLHDHPKVKEFMPIELEGLKSMQHVHDLHIVSEFGLMEKLIKFVEENVEDAV